MSNPKPIRTAAIALSVWVAVSSGSTFAQTTPQSQVEKNNADAAAADLARRQAEASLDAARTDLARTNGMMNALLTDSRAVIASANAGVERQRARNLQSEKDRLRDAFLSFQAARREFADALGFKGKLQSSARQIEKSSDAFVDFIKMRTKDRASIDASELKTFTATELQWETLAAAERLAPVLLAVVDEVDAPTVDIRFIQFLPQLEAELLRLQWMAKRIK